MVSPKSEIWEKLYPPKFINYGIIKCRDLGDLRSAAHRY